MAGAGGELGGQRLRPAHGLLIGLLGNQGTPTDIARDKHEMVAQALGEEFERKHQVRRAAG